MPNKDKSVEKGMEKEIYKTGEYLEKVCNMSPTQHCWLINRIYNLVTSAREETARKIKILIKEYNNYRHDKNNFSENEMLIFRDIINDLNSILKEAKR